MSESDFPTNLPLSPVSNSSRYSDESTDVEDFLLQEVSEDTINECESIDNDWETVIFPNSINVDSIPVENEEGKDVIEHLPPGSSPFSTEVEVSLWELNDNLPSQKYQEPVTLIQALHECNRDLIERVTQLEMDLKESHNLCKSQEILSEKFNLELKSRQAEITRLFAKLEQANQVIQQQAVVTENLTERLEKSQSRLAHIERECALTQERYNEQLHQIVQSENTCRELRSRLHRQQRQTLQFKAALEKCLERTSHQSREGFNSLMPSQTDVPVEKEESIIDEGLKLSLNEWNDDSHIETTFHNSPVKTWSDLEDMAREDSPSQTTELSDPVTLSSESSPPSILEESETILTTTVSESNAPSYVVEGKEEKTRSLGNLELPKFPSFSILDTTEDMKPNQEITKIPEIEIQNEEFERGINWDKFPQILPSNNSSDEIHWIQKLTYSANTKKRQSLAEIQLPSFC
jgi:hypothetical protein